jgi:hypothetical protein
MDRISYTRQCRHELRFTYLMRLPEEIQVMTAIFLNYASRKENKFAEKPCLLNPICQALRNDKRATVFMLYQRILSKSNEEEI